PPNTVTASDISIRRRPLTPPPFPYTTLFRSPLCPPRPRLRSLGRAPVGRPAESAAQERWRQRVAVLRDSRPVPAGFPGSARRRPDRKSTRLNSSHVKISYAVFCLKKKKKILP